MAVGASRLGIRVLIGWAFGSFATTVLVSSVGLLHLRFMTDSLGIGAAIAGSLVVISRFCDGMTDPVMGLITDRTWNRWGPRPFLFAGTLLCSVSMYALFNPPQVVGTALLAFMVFALLLFSAGHTVFRIPYLAMAAEMSNGFEERSRLTVYNVFGGSLGTLVATTLAPFLLAQWAAFLLQ
jgi:Na+/melibiose symporter-like transporter